MLKNAPTNAGDVRVAGLIPGLGRSPGEGNTAVFLPGGSHGQRSLVAFPAHLRMRPVSRGNSRRPRTYSQEPPPKPTPPPKPAPPLNPAPPSPGQGVLSHCEVSILCLYHIPCCHPSRPCANPQSHLSCGNRRGGLDS